MKLQNKGRLIWRLFILANCFVLTTSSIEERKLIRLLLGGTDTVARPVQHPWEVVNVTLRMWMLHVVLLDQVGSNLTISTNYRLRWDVPTMTWNPKDHGNVTSLHIQPSRIWTPDLVLQTTLMKENVKKGESRGSLLADTSVVITHKGKAEWRSPTITKTHCKMDTIYFPFDRHQCTMNFTLLSHTIKEANLLPEGSEALTIREAEVDYGIWHVEAGHVSQSLVNKGITPDLHPQLTLTLVLERKPLFYVYNVIYPAVVIMAVSLLGFCRPNKSGAKMVFGVSILVALNFFQKFLFKISFPTGEGIPLLGQLLCTGMIMAMIVVVSGVLGLRLYYKGSREPGYLPNPCLVKHLARLTCMQGYCKDLIDEEPIRITKYTRRDNEEQTTFTISTTNTWNQSLGDRILDNGANGAMKSIHHSSCPRPDSRVSLRSIVSEVSGLKELYKSRSKEDEVADKTRTAWELVTVMYQRLATMVCSLLLTAVVIGIFLQLVFRSRD